MLFELIQNVNKAKREISNEENHSVFIEE
jgi:hypothetical protein